MIENAVCMTSSLAAALWAACTRRTATRLQHDFDFDRQQVIDHAA